LSLSVIAAAALAVAVAGVVALGFARRQRM
jgi:hypothetical protein